MIRRALPALALVAYILAAGGCLGLVDRPADWSAELAPIRAILARVDG